jgi:SAM-dependent methyltransferase
VSGTDVMPVKIPRSETRSYERMREHYLVEKELAGRLRHASKDERRFLYSAVYDELFRSIPDHPQLRRKLDVQNRGAEISQRLALLRTYLRPETAYLEIGPGDCSLAIEVAKLVKKVYAVDVSEVIVAGVALPPNVEHVVSDGCSIPVPANSVDVAYSDQLMEHLHPDDAAEQLRNIYNALAPGGVYICITPNRWSGPHDVSRYFDEVATGFHLREYTVGELAKMFRAVGFRRPRVLLGARGTHVATPADLVKSIESLLTVFPVRFGRILARALPLRVILGAKLIARK